MWDKKIEKVDEKVLRKLEDRLLQIEHLLYKLMDEVHEPQKEMKYLDVAQAAKILCLSRAQLYVLMKDGKIPYTHVGRQRRLILADLVDYVHKGYKPVQNSII